MGFGDTALCSHSFQLCLAPPAQVSGAAVSSSSPCNTPIPHSRIPAPLRLPLPLCPFAATEACMATHTQGDGKYSSDSSPTKPNRVLIRGRFLSALEHGWLQCGAQHTSARQHMALLRRHWSEMGRGGQGGVPAWSAGCFGKRGAR